MFSRPDYDGHEALLFAQDTASGLRALIAIHDTTLGPAFGGCRMYPYASEQQAMTDVLRLSRGMTYKAAICELPYGGGKSVIIADPRRDKTPALLHAMGRIIEGLGGRYITADDVGTTLGDLVIMREVTCHTGRAPGRRTRSDGSSCANSLRPRPIVLGAMPVAIATAVMPPYPAANASAAATRRRPRSSRKGATVKNRSRMGSTSITTTIYGMKRRLQTLYSLSQKSIR